MSLRKAIKSGDEHRKPYRRSKSFDRSCRNHGSCPYCEKGRIHKHERRSPITYSKETVYQKSERLFQEYLDNVSDEEFLELYDRCENYKGPTIDEFMSWMPINQK